MSSQTSTTKTIYDHLYINAKICTMQGGHYNIIERGAIGIKGHRISYVGSFANMPRNAEYAHIHDVKSKLITPAFIDCHTHLIYGGNRATEFEQRLTGVSYEEIARQGGGIMSTVNATRAASEDDLYNAALKRLNILRAEGVVALEIKSGYGLNLETERKMLRVAKRLRDETGLTIQHTFLGAHAVPPEYKNRADDYIDYVCNEIMPALHQEGLIDAVDVFCENIAFNIDQTRRVFDTAQKLNLPVKIHAEQLSNMAGTKCAADYNALSADHIEYLDEKGVHAIASVKTRTGNNMVATLLPGAFYTLRETQKPPIRLLRDYNVPMALASDHNPGSSPTLSLILMMNMGCTCFQITPEEALAGTTLNAAKALRIDNDYGSIEIGKKACFIVWDDISEPAELSYRFGYTPSHKLIYNGLRQTLEI